MSGEPAPPPADIDVDELISYLEESSIRLAVFGEFSAGKTTVLNALIGEEILSVAVEPTTAVPTRIRYGREFNIYVDRVEDGPLALFENDPPFWTRFVGRRDILSTLEKQQDTIRDFLQRWTKEGEQANQVKRVVIELPLEWLKGGLELVDTPGVNNEFVRHQGFTEQEASTADIAVLLMDARQGGGKRTEFEFMNEVQKQVERCIVAPNKMDLVPADEREEFLDFIREEALPNHWEGAVTPQVIGISALAALHPGEHDEPGLVDSFNRLEKQLEEIAKAERGKLLLARKGKPEKELFARARELEADEFYGRAHRLYFDLLDILEAADLDPAPAEEGVARCEEHLSAQVDALDALNERHNEAMAIAEDDPDTALERLRDIRDEKADLRLKDGDLQASIEQLQNRIEEREQARSRILRTKKAVKQHRQNENWIEAAEKAKKSLQWIDAAELSEDEEARLRAFVETQIEDLDEWKANRQREVEEALNQASEEPEEALKRLRKVYNERKSLEGSGIELEKRLVSLEERVRRSDEAQKRIKELKELATAYEESEEWIEAAEAATKIRPLIGTAELSENEEKGVRKFIQQKVRDRDKWAEQRWKEIKANIDRHADNGRLLAARNLLETLEEVAHYTPFEDETDEVVEYIRKRDKAQQVYLEVLRDALSTAQVLRQDRVEPDEGLAVESAVEEVNTVYRSYYELPVDLPEYEPISDSAASLTIDQKLGLALRLKILAEPSPEAEEAISLVESLCGLLADRLPLWASLNRFKHALSKIKKYRNYLPEKCAEEKASVIRNRVSFRKRIIGSLKFTPILVLYSYTVLINNNTYPSMEKMAGGGYYFLKIWISFFYVISGLFLNYSEAYKLIFGNKKIGKEYYLVLSFNIVMSIVLVAEW